MKNAFVTNAIRLLAAGAMLTACMAASAGNHVNWSVSVGVPPPAVYYSPPPVYVQPQPVYVQPQPTFIQPQPVYVQPAPVPYGAVVYYDGYGRPYYRYHHRHHHHW